MTPSAPGAETGIDTLRRLHTDTRQPPPDKVAVLTKNWKDDSGRMRSLSLDYVGHADVTDLLLAFDPLWDWEPVAWTDDGLPKVDRDSNGWPRGLWIRLTVCGHSRLGYGTCAAGKADAIKELIGDAIRNAAMRFGVALSLWSKAEWAELHEDHRPGGRPDQEGGPQAPSDNKGNSSGKSPTSPGPRAAVTPTAAGGEPVLPQDQLIAAAAARHGIDDATRQDVLFAISKGRTRSGKELRTAQEVKRTLDALDGLADGTVELRYDPDGVPSLFKVPKKASA